MPIAPGCTGPSQVIEIIAFIAHTCLFIMALCLPLNTGKSIKSTLK